MSGNRAPVAALFLLSPLVAEVLSGSTPLTGLAGLVFFIPMYGGAAVLIREISVRRDRGLPVVLLLGLAFALLEEGLVVQAIFHPQAVEAASWGAAGGRVLGAHVTFTLAVLVYHAIWSITLPILLCDLLFPGSRSRPLLGRTGLAVMAAVLLAGLTLVAVLVRVRIAPGHPTPVARSLGVALAVGVLCLIAVRFPSRGRRRPLPPGGGSGISGTAGPAAPWVISLASAAAGSAFLLALMVPIAFDPRPLPEPVSVAAAVVIAIVALAASRRAGHWSDRHRFALAGGLLPVPPAIGLVQAALHGYGTPGDRAGLVALLAATIILLIGIHAKGFSPR
ncbi:hypothetical protein [Bailinhaonella thermotolerans]|uniref:Uncharacterized protein n=1 Tax=Bailinhaonella thermotolerans TaxID=1070861 RepID=A0A3A4AYN4_9ACTN|nr:hypothetical protein [Bailinhaonella thermotolerans]RJL35782.1 hypothetical protein D5H75_03085 [Bailinhaonella thermotolerans]